MPARTLVATALAFLVTSWICSPGAFAQTTPGAIIRGEVTDSSGGVLPGVTVVATTADDMLLATTVTDAEGRYTFRGVRAGSTKLVLRLDGFETAIVNLTTRAGAEVSVVERLKLARMTEEVVVYGKAPADPPPPSMPYIPPPPPVVIPVPAQELETVCRPAKPGATMGPFGTIQSHRFETGRMLYAKGDQIVIDGGTSNGIEVGRNLIAMRYFRANSRGDIATMGEHAAGLVQIVAADEHAATGVVVHACNELMQGDLLVAFAPEPLHRPTAAGTPAYDEAARILFADAGQLLGAPRRMMVIDRGSEQGIEAGQRLTLFKRGGDRTPPRVIGEAVVVSVRASSATIRIIGATDAIDFGDWAAPQRP